METRLTFSSLGLPIAAIGRYEYSTSKRSEEPQMEKRAASDASNPQAVYFPPADAGYYRWSSIVNQDFVYTFLMPVTAETLHNVSTTILLLSAP